MQISCSYYNIRGTFQKLAGGRGVESRGKVIFSSAIEKERARKKIGQICLNI